MTNMIELPILQVGGSNIRACLAAARRSLGLKIAKSRELFRSGGEDRLYRVHLASGHIIEITIIPHTKVKIVSP